MARSERKTDIFGNEYIQHYDDAGKEIGRSEQKTGVFGDEYTEHRDERGGDAGRSEEKTGIFGDEYTEHRDAHGRDAGRSEQKTGVFGDEYTEHRDERGRSVGRSEHKTGVFGDEYVEHEVERDARRGPPIFTRPWPRLSSGSGSSSDFGTFFWSMMLFALAIIFWFIVALWRYRYLRAAFFLYVAVVFQFGVFASLVSSNVHFIISAIAAAAVSTLLYRFCFSSLRWRAGEGARVNAWQISGIMAATTLVAYLVVGLTQPAFTTNPVGAVRQSVGVGSQRVVAGSTSPARNERVQPMAPPAQGEIQAEDEVVGDEQPADDQQVIEQTDDDAFAAAQSANTAEAYNAYLDGHPSGRHSEDARSALSDLEKPAYAPYDLAQLHPNVRAVVEQARAAQQRAEVVALRAGQAAELAEIAARRARAGESGTRAATLTGGNPRITVRNETEWRDGAINGYGVQTVIAGAFLIGDRYAGQWRDGHLNGVGIILRSQNQNNTGDVLRYEGEFSNDREHGLGMRFWRSGERYAGGFRDGRVNGPGVLYWPNGRRHEGQYVTGRSNGYGVLWDAQGGVSQEGTWRDGVFAGPVPR